MTAQSEPDDEQRVAVLVAVREAPTAEDGERMHERPLLLMDAYWSKLVADGEET